MGFLQKLSKLFTPAPYDRNYYIYVQCSRCGEKIQARVDLSNDLSPEYESTDDASQYYCRKVLIGEKRCFQPIEVILKFDAQRRLIDSAITGGKFLSEEQYREQ